LLYRHNPPSAKWRGVDWYKITGRVWFRRLVAALSPRRPVFDPTPVNVVYVEDEVALGQDLPQYFGLPLSLSFHQYSIHIHSSFTDAK
jgi:hypothetical protein